MDPHRILSTYEHIAGLMGRMLEAARAREWERLRVLESNCQESIGKLKSANLDVPMSAPLRKRRTQLIGEVLRADAQIRDLTEPWSAQLRLLLAGGDRRRATRRGGSTPYAKSLRSRTK